MIPVLVESAFRSLVVGALVWGGLRLFRVRNVVAQKAAWGLVLGLAIAMPMLLPVTNSWQLLPKQEGIVLPANPQTLLEELQSKIQAKRAPARPAAEAVAPAAANIGSAPESAKAPQAALSAPESDAAQVADSAAPSPLSAPSRNVPLALGPADAITEMGSAPPQAAHVAPQRPAISPAGIAIVGYFAVMVFFFVRLVYGVTAALRLWYMARPVPAEFLSQFGMVRGVRSSRNVASPVTVGSAVVLPSDYMTWESQKLRIVLAHECSHVRQGDFYLQLLAGVYAATFWFSPMGWWIKRRLSELAEAISDRAGLEQARSRWSYAQLLLEFAGAPRPTPVGVAMARRSNISRRIEQFLNDSTFQQAFAGGWRALAAVLLVPVAFLVATAFVRVQAAGQAQTTAAQLREGVSNPEPVTVRQESQPAAASPAAPAAAPTPEVLAAPAVVPAPRVLAAPAAAPTPAELESPPAPPASPETVAPQEAPAVPVPSAGPVGPATTPQDVHVPPVDVHVPATHVHVPGTDVHVPARDIRVPEMKMYIPVKDIHVPAIDTHVSARDFTAPEVNVHVPEMNLHGADPEGPWFLAPNGKLIQDGYGYHFSTNGDWYAIVHRDGEATQFSGDWVDGHRQEIDKARKQARGDFLWFTRDGKSYFVDDQRAIAQIKSMYAPMEALGKQQAALGRKQEELGKQQEELGRRQEQIKIPGTEFSKEMAQLKKELEKATAELDRQSGKSNEEQLVEVQAMLAEVQSQLGARRGELRARRGDFGGKMGELGRLQGALGAERGRLGAEQGRLAREADRTVKSIIDESLKSGKAHPVD